MYFRTRIRDGSRNLEREGGGVGALEPTILDKVENAAVLQETFFSIVLLIKYFQSCQQKGERWGGGAEGHGPFP